MRKPNPHTLTYLAQVRQLHFKSEWLYPLLVPITPHFLPIKPNKKLGILHKEIVIIGIVRVADWVEQSKSMGAWLKVVGFWLKTMICISSQSHAKERK